MSQPRALLLLAILFLAVLLAGGRLGMLTRRRAARFALRMEAARGGGGRPTPDAAPPLRLIERVGAVMLRSGMLSAGTIAQLEASLAAAGDRRRGQLSVFVGTKLLLFALLPVLAFVLLHGRGLRPLFLDVGVAGSAVLGLLLPDYVLRSRRAAYLKALQRALPDALDMMVICAEAGLGLEPAIDRVAGEIRGAAAEIADEFALTAQEMRIIADRRVALSNMGTRTGLESLRRLGSTLIQTLQYGTPLSQALRTLSTEMRQEQLTRFEAQAARLPVLLTVPMIVFILPCVFMIVGGPAVLQASRTLIHH